MSAFVNRLIGAARLDVPTYEEVEHDRSATGQAAAVVVLAAIAAGIGVLRSASFSALILFAIVSLISWAVSAAIIWFVGTKLLAQPQTEADIGQLLRTMGFAAAPGLLRVFEILPLIGGLIGLIIWIWLLATLVVAVRQALDYDSTPRAIAVCLIGWIIQVLLSGIFGGMLMFGAGGPPAGGGAI